MYTYIYTHTYNHIYIYTYGPNIIRSLSPGISSTVPVGGQPGMANLCGLWLAPAGGQRSAGAVSRSLVFNNHDNNI